MLRKEKLETYFNSMPFVCVLNEDQLERCYRWIVLEEEMKCAILLVDIMHIFVAATIFI
jgi:hypothetical protein